jgi:ribosomal protein L22
MTPEDEETPETESEETSRPEPEPEERHRRRRRRRFRRAPSSEGAEPTEVEAELSADDEPDEFVEPEEPDEFIEPEEPDEFDELDETPEDVEAEEEAADVVLEADAEAEDEGEGEAEAEAEAEAEEEALADLEQEPDLEVEAPEEGRRAGGAAEPAEVEAPPAPAARRGRRGERAPGPPPVVRAQAKYVRSSARKARLVCDHIRGKSVEEARAILTHTPRSVARDWSKLLESAVANAENNHELVGEDLYVMAVHADEGPTIRRFRPRAMGRATRIRKRTSHLTILLTPKD